VPALALRPASPADNSPGSDRDSAQQDGFLREVDEALRQDEMTSAVKRYGLAIGTAVGVGLLALAGYLWWDGHTKQQAGERGEQMTLALDRIDGNQIAVGDALLIPLSKNPADGTRATAQLMRAGIALQQGRTDEAEKTYATVAADTGVPQPLRDLATVRKVAAGFDTLPPQQVVDQLKSFAIPGNPWFGSAGEMVGMAYLKLGKNDLAGPLFAAISKDKTVPESLRNRTRQLAGLLGVDAVEDSVTVSNAAQAAPTPAPQSQATPAKK
jgi:hypothetical protein